MVLYYKGNILITLSIKILNYIFMTTLVRMNMIIKKKNIIGLASMVGPRLEKGT